MKYNIFQRTVGVGPDERREVVNEEMYGVDHETVKKEEQKFLDIVGETTPIGRGETDNGYKIHSWFGDEFLVERCEK
ncbi:MAG: hypothetical protein ABIK73_07850 [candidate division WOR-3 bacterium]